MSIESINIKKFKDRHPRYLKIAGRTSFPVSHLGCGVFYRQSFDMESGYGTEVVQVTLLRRTLASSP